MSETVKKTTQTPESYSPKKPFILYIAEEYQKETIAELHEIRRL